VPVYEYQCQACKREFEYQQRMSDPDKTVCEACGGALERLISRTAFQLKGSGWYKDLYSSAKPAADAKPAGDSGAAATPAAPASAPASTPAAAPASSPAPASGGGSSSGSTSGGGSSGSGSSGGGTSAKAPR